MAEYSPTYSGFISEEMDVTLTEQQKTLLQELLKVTPPAPLKKGSIKYATGGNIPKPSPISWDVVSSEQILKDMQAFKAKYAGGYYAKTQEFKYQVQTQHTISLHWSEAKQAYRVFCSCGDEDYFSLSAAAQDWGMWHLQTASWKPPTPSEPDTESAFWDGD